MATIGFSEAARLAGVSRQHLYKMAEAGQFSVNKELLPGKSGISLKDYRQTIDTAELYRVFGRLTGVGTGTCQPMTPDDSAVKVLEMELKAVRQLLQEREEQLQEAKEREEWFKKQIDESQKVVKLIGHSVPVGSVSRDKHERIISAGQAKIDRLQEEIWQQQNRGFWARLINK